MPATITLSGADGMKTVYAWFKDSAGNLSADPRFTRRSGDGDWSNDNFRLQSSSPAINAGAGTDFDGSQADLGAYGGADGGW